MSEQPTWRQHLNNASTLVDRAALHMVGVVQARDAEIEKLHKALADARPVAHLHIDQAFHVELEAELKRTCAELTAARAEVAKWKEAVARENRNLVNNINKCITLQDAIQPVRKERNEARAEVERLKAASPDKHVVAALERELHSVQVAWQSALAERNDLARKLEALKTVLFPAVRLEGL